MHRKIEGIKIERHRKTVREKEKVSKGERGIKKNEIDGRKMDR